MPRSGPRCEAIPCHCDKKARDQFAKIIEFVADDWPEFAERLTTEIEAAMASLDHMPQRFVQVGFSRKCRSPVHRVVVDSYLIYYRIESESVHVLMIRDGAQRPPKSFD